APFRTRRGGTPRGCRLASDGDGRESEDLGDLVEVEAGLAREVRALVGGVAHVDRDERAPAGLAEELGVDPGGVEAGHGADGQARGAQPDDEVADLDEGVRAGHALA